MPSVPTMAQRGCAGVVLLSAWASHQALEVLPLVPVMASTSNCSEGAP